MKQTIVQELIDIYWSNLKNQEVIEKTYEKFAAGVTIPGCLSRYREMMALSFSNETRPLLIIEPYGTALEKLEPHYYAEKQSIFYQERC